MISGRPALEAGGDEPGHDRRVLGVRVLARPEDVEVAQDDGLDAAGAHPGCGRSARRRACSRAYGDVGAGQLRLAAGQAPASRRRRTTSRRRRPAAPVARGREHDLDRARRRSRRSSRRGSATERATDGSAASWRIDVAARHRPRRARPGRADVALDELDAVEHRLEPATRSRSTGRRARRPRRRPRGARATRWCPMNPAPPVTRTLTRSYGETGWRAASHRRAHSSNMSSSHSRRAWSARPAEVLGQQPSAATSWSRWSRRRASGARTMSRYTPAEVAPEPALDAAPRSPSSAGRRAAAGSSVLGDLAQDDLGRAAAASCGRAAAAPRTRRARGRAAAPGPRASWPSSPGPS